MGILPSFRMSAVFAALIFILAGAACAAPERASASRLSIKVDGIDYVDARTVFKRLGFNLAWVAPGKRMRIHTNKTEIFIEADKRDVTVNGLRVLMGEPAVVRGTALYLSRIDADALFLPVLSPSSVKNPPAPALKVIVLDAGHGGQDAGTQNKALKLDEKRFTLDVANRLRALLVKQGYKVVMTRTTDRFIALPERAEIANRAGADLFISIHFNSVDKAPLVQGSETYVMTPQHHRSTGSPLRDPSDRVANSGNLNDPWNAVLGYHMQASMVTDLGTFDRGLKRARFAVLRHVKSPAVLVEAGYLSNEAEAKKIATPAYRAAIAEALAKGVSAYALAISTAKRDEMVSQ